MFWSGFPVLTRTGVPRPLRGSFPDWKRVQIVPTLRNLVRGALAPRQANYENSNHDRSEAGYAAPLPAGRCRSGAFRGMQQPPASTGIPGGKTDRLRPVHPPVHHIHSYHRGAKKRRLLARAGRTRETLPIHAKGGLLSAAAQSADPEFLQFGIAGGAKRHPPPRGRAALLRSPKSELGTGAPLRTLVEPGRLGAKKRSPLLAERASCADGLSKNYAVAARRAWSMSALMSSTFSKPTARRM